MRFSILSYGDIQPDLSYAQEGERNHMTEA